MKFKVEFVTSILTSGCISIFTSDFLKLMNLTNFKNLNYIVKKIKMKNPACIFCNIEDDKILLRNERAFLINDKFPDSKGHMLVIPFEHEENFFDLSKQDKIAIVELLDEAKKLSDREHKPAGYNVTINIGRPAGQIIMHAHVHLIPRYEKNK